MSLRGLIGEAVDREVGSLHREDRAIAVDAIRVLKGRLPAPDELDRVIEEERAGARRSVTFFGALEV